MAQQGVWWSKVRRREQSSGAASPVRHIYHREDDWTPWRELTADDRVPMTGEVYSAIALGGWMFERSKR